MVKFIVTGLLLLCTLVPGGCAYLAQPAIREEFDKSIKAYNRMLRWQELEQAGMSYMEPEKRDGFMKQVESLKKRGVTFTDFRIVTSDYLLEKKTADVVAEFDYYILPSNRIKTVTYRQHWVYQDLIKNWKLASELPDFE